MYLRMYVFMYVCLSVMFYNLNNYTSIHIVHVLPSSWRSVSAVVVRWRTQRTEDDDWLGNKPRGIEDE